MAVGNVGNALMGPCDVYAGALGVITAAPTDPLINAAPAASAWFDLGGTNGGVDFQYQPKMTELMFDQVVDIVEERLTSRVIQVVANLAEGTLANLATSMNCTLESAGSNSLSFHPVYDKTATQTPKISLLLDGFAPPVTTPTPIANPRRRIYIPRAQQIGNIAITYAKDKQQVLSCTFKAYYVSGTIAPVRVTDQTGV